ncbi:MAG: OmpA family protein [Albidovulum sp.]|uniref:OmpA family protein n=1 Tax=Albidovulum sp. TaxID=1872424 RepID=UPI003CAFA95E
MKTLLSLKIVKTTETEDGVRTSKGDERPGLVDRIPPELFSAPGLLILLTAPALAVYDRLWRGWLGIDLPIGSVTSGAGAFLAAELVALFGLLFAAYLSVGWALSRVARAIGRVKARFSEEGRRSKRAMRRLKFYWLIHYIRLSAANKWLRMINFFRRRKTEPCDVKRQVAGETADMLRIAARFRLGYKRRLQEQSRKADRFIAWLWRSLFNGERITVRTVLFRVSAITAIALLSCAPLYSMAQSAKTRIGDTGTKDERRVKCETVLVGGSVATLMETVGLPLANRIPCGRAYLSDRHSVIAAGLKPALLPSTLSGTQMTEEVFHLGRYGDWEVFAPHRAPGERIILKAAMVQQFLPSKPMTAPWSVAGHLRMIRTTLLTFGRSAHSYARSLISSAISQATDLARLQTDLDLLNVRVDELAALQVTVQLPKPEVFVTVLNETGNDIGMSDVLSGLGNAVEALTHATTALNSAGNRMSDSVAVPVPGFVHGSRQQLIRAFGEDGMNECDNVQVDGPDIFFSEGSFVPNDPGPIVAFAEKFKNLRKSGVKRDNHHIIFLTGYASATGLSAQNADLADRRADRVKSIFVQKLFNLSPRRADEEGHEHLRKDNISVVAFGAGETIDDRNMDMDVSPRRVEIRYCTISATDKAAYETVSTFR